MTVLNQQTNRNIGNIAPFSSGGHITSSLIIDDDVNLVFGTGNTSTTSSIFQWDTAETVDCLKLGLDQTSRRFMILDYGDVNTDSGLSAASNPTLSIFAAAYDATKRVDIYHDGTNTHIDTGTGAVHFGLSSDNDLIAGSFSGVVFLADDIQLRFGNTAVSADVKVQFSTNQTVDALMFGVDETSRSFHLCDAGDVSFNFANSAQSHPTLFLHSSAQSTTQFATLSQTGTNLEIKNTGAAGSTTVFTGGATGIALQSTADQNILVGGGGFLLLRSSSSGIRQNNGIEMIENSSAFGWWVNGTRFQHDQGADVASAGDLTLGNGNSFEITGTTTINAITTTNWQNGARVTLHFTSTPTVKHNTAGGASTAVMMLAGSIDFTPTAGSCLSLEYIEIGGTSAWRETGRSVR